MYQYEDGGLKNIWLVNGYTVKKTLYGNAGDYLARYQGGEKIKLSRDYGFRSLSDFIESVQIFELATEPCGTDTRQIYRLRSE